MVLDSKKRQIEDDVIPFDLGGKILIQTEEERAAWEKSVALEQTLSNAAVAKTRSTLRRSKKGGRPSSGQRSVVEKQNQDQELQSIRYAEEQWEQQGPNPWDE